MSRPVGILMIHPLSPQLDVPQGRIQKCYLYYRIWFQNRAVRRQKKAPRTGASGAFQGAYIVNAVLEASGRQALLL